MGAKAYLASALTVFILLCAGCIALSVLADPYWMFDTYTISGVNALKPRIYERVELAKTYQLERIRPRTILLGNSRTEVGFDPESKVWPASWRPVFNAGLAGGDLFMVSRIFQEAIASGQVNIAILEADFPDFLTKPSSTHRSIPLTTGERRLLVKRDGMLNPDREMQIWRDRLATTLTINSLEDSLLTLINQHPGTTETMTRFGFNPLHQYAADVKRIGYYGIFAQKRAAYDARFQRYPHPDFARPMRYADFRDLLQIIETAHDHSVRLVIFIPPYHAQLLEIIERDGLWSSFEDWKRALVQVIAAKCSTMKATPCPIPLVDFSGYNAYTTEPVPPKGDTHTQTRWYWEAGHYKAALGDVMLNRLISGAGTFGQALTKTSIEGVLKSERKSRPFATNSSAG
jgi:hypothetical protein